MAEFAKANFSLKRLVDNSYKAIDQGAYEIEQLASHNTISISEVISLSAHAPLITEIKFSSPSQGKIRSRAEPTKIAKTMINAGAIGLSVLTQPFLFDGSIEYLAAIRKALPTIPILMKDIIVSPVQIDAGKKVGADCVLLIKSVFDRNLAEDSIEIFLEYAKNRGVEVLIEVHTEKEFAEVLKTNHHLVGINNRNLDNLKVDITNTETLLKRYNKGKSIIISESGISSPKDIKYLKSVGADAFLVGTSVMQTSDIAAKITEMYYAV